jgi:MOB kinase activator 1
MAVARSRRRSESSKKQTMLFARGVRILTPKYSQLTKVTGAVLTHDFVLLCECPATHTQDDWIIVNCIDFLNRIDLFFSSCSLFCTVSTCPMFNAGPEYQYFWEDTDTARVQLSAPEYFNTLKRWIRRHLSNRAVFPRESGTRMSPDADDIMKTAYRRMLRVFAHMYTCHFHEIQKQNLEPVANTMLAHYLMFVMMYQLVPFPELSMLMPVVDKLGQALPSV